MIVVTGGAGFIGSAFIWKLNSEGINDILVVDELKESEKWKNLVGLSYTDYLHKDQFLDLLTNDAFDNIDAIIHMGACSATTEKNGDYLFENNYRYTQILCDWCLDNDAYFQYASSAATYGEGEHGFKDDHGIIPKLQPINRYGYSKQFFDLFALREEAIDGIVGLKFFNVFGPNEYHKGSMKSVVCKAHQQILETGKIELFKSYKKDYEHGGQMRDFVYVKDVVNIMYWLMKNPKVTGIYNVGFGTARTWNDLAKALFKALKKKENINYIEMPDNLKNQYQYYTEASTAKLKAAGCPVKMTSLEEAIEDYVVNFLNDGVYLTRKTGI